LRIEEYFSDIKSLLNISPVIASYSVTEEFAKDLEGYIRIKSTLINGDFLELFIYATVEVELRVQKYSFHWQSKEGNLRKRWDNSPHHREIKTFPHHLHIGDKVVPCTRIDFSDVLNEITTTIYREEST
jgi:hypothetical protein